jgi:hypothetical protein
VTPNPKKTDIGYEISSGDSIPSASGTVQLTDLIIIHFAMHPGIHIILRIETKLRAVSKRKSGRPGELEWKNERRRTAVHS